MGNKQNKNNGERRPDHKTNFYVPIEGKEVYLGSDNCTIYTHSFEPWYDHIFLEADKDGEGNRSGYFLWRLKQENFDKMVEALQGINTEHRATDIASSMDKNTFKQQGLTVPEFKEPEPETLTPRQVKTLGAFAYYLEHGHIAPEDFDGDEVRELFI